LTVFLILVMVIFIYIITIRTKLLGVRLRFDETKQYKNGIAA
jgi:hypothetical protein